MVCLSKDKFAGLKALVSVRAVPTLLHVLCSVPVSSSTISAQSFECCVTAIDFHVPFVPCSVAERNGHNNERESN